MIIKVRILKTSKNFLTHKGITIISVTQRKHLAECQKVTQNTINATSDEKASQFVCVCVYWNKCSL